MTVIHCRESEGALRDYFLGVIEGVLPLLGAAPSEARVREVVVALVELFRALELPPRKSVQGLWGELYVIVQATDALALVGAWHVAPEEPYDFTDDSQRVEVKSVSGETRSHYFSMVQLHPPAGAVAVVASLFVDRAGGGVSVGDLLERARSRLMARPDLAVRLDHIVAATLGNNWRNGLEERFDWERAQESLIFFAAESIPSIRPVDVPPEVREVTFRSDLLRVTPAKLGMLREQGGLFHAVLPLRAGRP